jgi:hypothetical protein
MTNLDIIQKASDSIKQFTTVEVIHNYPGKLK